MSFTKKTIKDIDIRGKKLLVRVDYSVELDEHGEICDDYKLRATLPTINYALEQGAAVVLISHMGRPDGVFASSLSLFVVAKRLRELLEREVDFIPSCSGERAAKAKKCLEPGDVVLFENLRFDKREAANDHDFASELATDMDVFVQDGFAVCYRMHTSVDAITKCLPSVAGLLLEREVDELSAVLSDETDKTLVIINGLSIGERLPLIEQMLRKASAIAFGGVIADVFLNASGVKTGKSPIDPSELPLAQELLHRFREAKQERSMQIYLPYDAVVAAKTDVSTKTRLVDWSAHVVADIEAYPRRALHEASQVQDDEIIVDIGPFTGAYLAGVIQSIDTVLLVGTPGDTKVHGSRGPIGPFAHGTELVLEAMSGQFGRRPKHTIVVGDDAVEYVTRRKLERAFTHVSTGGGASLELLSGRSLVGLDVLEDRQ